MEKEEIRRLMEELAQAPANDAVEVAMSGLDAVTGFDLRAVTEFKRNANGSVEIKFIDRLAALKWLAETADQDSRARVDAFYSALRGGESTD